MEDLNKAKEIYNENKGWITWKKLPGSLEKDLLKDLKSFFVEYRRLKGEKEWEDYKKDVITFLKITYNPYILRDLKKFYKSPSNWKDRGEALLCFIGYIGEELEAKRIFSSIDEVHPYS